ncbi:hypothetical protein [Actinobacillus equuli]|nr:hypothetical protein [Actinobacillus equuli]WGE59690.1 hypothetical protein NYR73_02805 [Actinobacillus equuli subsp. haemolyticus]WGE61670.1 hypothetical protein NYR74_02670 [Actinobacillus equuli subsp. haemolyticus]WGE77798.1 hypothetical protein NYR82_02715 [Actinobacillus equuli subsp. haemolyticus]
MPKKAKNMLGDKLIAEPKSGWRTDAIAIEDFEHYPIRRKG